MQFPSTANLCRLKVEIEFERADFKCANQREFEALCQSAVRQVLGEAAPQFQVEKEFVVETQTGAVIFEESHLNKLWASLSVFGHYLGSNLAIRMQEISRVELIA
ncbi:hypothetical protein M3Y95_00516500 [Aphelenchoides besseyi]|nr:hypothetical protein M3Y95_00516500 [Aphelenchoides besseyi]